MPVNINRVKANVTSFFNVFSFEMGTEDCIFSWTDSIYKNAMVKNIT